MKNWIIISITLCFFSPYTALLASTEILPLKPLDDLPRSTVVSEYAQRIRDAYTALQSHLSSAAAKTTQGYFGQYDQTINLNTKLQEAIFWPYAASSYQNEESNVLIPLINEIIGNIFSYMEQYHGEYEKLTVHTFWPTYEMAEKRYRLASIIKLIHEGEGYFAHAPATNKLLVTIKPAFRCLEEYTGRIFVVNPQEGKIISTFCGPHSSLKCNTVKLIEESFRWREPSQFLSGCFVIIG